MSAEDEIRSVSKQFYAALGRVLNGDASAMADVWSHGANVTTMHPIGGREVGWQSVEESFTQVAKLSSDGQVEIHDQRIQVAADMAYELGVEKGQFTLAGKQIAVEQERVTNVYRREGGAWKMVHHHSDLSPAMQDLLRSLRAKA
jgi:uncharacterized protein (TIGR02246 family)